jgi:hypothetical protein
MVDDNVIIRRIIAAADTYANQLLNNNILFVYEIAPMRYAYFEADFEKRCFLHLTGISPSNSMTSVSVFDKCLSRTITNDDVIIPRDGTVELKMEVLDCAMNIHKNSRMVGDFNNSRIKLETDRIAGSTHGCMGFVVDNNTGFYVPNTLLKEDLRDITTKTHRVLAVYSKSKWQAHYSVLRYTAKGISANQVEWNPKINKLIEAPLTIDYR